MCHLFACRPCVQYATCRERIKTLQAQLQSATEQARADADARLSQQSAQHQDEKSTLEAVIQALEGETRSAQQQLQEETTEKDAVLKRCAELEQLLTTRDVDTTAKVNDLEARLDESQSANADMQKSYQRQVHVCACVCIVDGWSGVC